MNFKGEILPKLQTNIFRLCSLQIYINLLNDLKSLFYCYIDLVQN